MAEKHIWEGEKAKDIEGGWLETADKVLYDLEDIFNNAGLKPGDKLRITVEVLE